MRYFGSKASTLSALASLIPAASDGAVACDPFGGIAVVGGWLRARGYSVVTGDVLTFATMFQTSRVVLTRRPRFERLERYGLKGHDEVITALQSATASGWVYRQFAIQRQYFTNTNARHIDGARRLIWRWKRMGLTTNAEHAYLVAGLIDSMDRVANTAGTYYAHLKQWTPKARKPFLFRPLPIISGRPGTSILGEAKDLVQRGHYEVLYLDPPYNRRSYERYYHLPETIATGRRAQPTGLSGVSAAAATAERSPFNTSKAGAALSALITAASFDILVFHYSDDGLIPPVEVDDVLRRFGRVESHQTSAWGYSTGQHRRVQHRLWVVRT